MAVQTDVMEKSKQFILIHKLQEASAHVPSVKIVMEMALLNQVQSSFII